MASGEPSRNPESWLLCRVGARLCGLRLGDVVETMRPLPVAAIAGAPAFVSGLCTLRGAAVPVVDAAALLGEAEGNSRRLVRLAVGDREVALAVGAVLGVHRFTPEQCERLPPLLAGAAADAVAAVAARDGDLLLLLDSFRLVPGDDALAGAAL